MMSNSSRLPEDLIFEILSRLPVKSLLRFKSVCKSWRSMITGRRFVSEHLKRSSSMSGSSAGVRHLQLHILGERHMIAQLSSTLEVLIREAQLPTMIGSRNFEIAGSCNGIVCLMSQNGPVVLWNPATRESRTVPNSVGKYVWIFCYGHWRSPKVQYGFGYSSKIDDYKLVRIKGDCDRPVAEVFTLREGSWREVHPPDYYPDDYVIGGTLVNGTLNWFAPGGGDESRGILSCDLEKDEFKSISLPPRFAEGISKKKKLAALESSLLFIAYTWGTADGFIDLWTANPQATQPIWTRLSTIHPPFRNALPLGMGKLGEINIVYIYGDFRRLYACEASTGNDLYSIARLPSYNDLHPYVESLAPLLGE